MYEKYFCIGVGKTGTTSLHKMAIAAGLRACHEWDWSRDPKKLQNFEFFSDGGGHYIGCEHTLDFKKLNKNFSDKLFILNYRDVKSWIISKCKHAGWKKDTVIEQDRLCNWRDYKEKNLLNVKRFIDFYFYYYINSARYLIDNKSDAIRVDVVNNINVDRLKKILGIKGEQKFWSNKSSDDELPEKLNIFIDETIKKHYISQKKLNHLLKTMDTACRVKK